MVQFYLMYLKLLALIWNARLTAGMSCCLQTNSLSSEQELNEGEIFYFDFVINELPNATNTNLIVIERESQLRLMIIKQNQQFMFSMKIDNRSMIEIHQVQLGVFQQLFIKYDKEYMIIEWYSDFQIIYKQNLGSSIQNTKIIKKQNFLCQQQIQKEYQEQFITSCKDASNIKVQMHPQLKYLHSETFNNNFYKISFWIKQLVQDDQFMNIQIIDEINGKCIMIVIEWLYCAFLYDNIIIMKDTWKISGWSFFQFSYQQKHGVFKYQRDDYEKEILLPQNFQYQVRLYVRPHKNIIFTEALIQISSQSNWILCVPGCLKCDTAGQCQECDISYQHEGNFCECQEDFRFLFSPSECYIKLDYKILENNKSRNNCPTFGGQKCPQCEGDSVDTFSYCLFATDINLYQESLQLDYNYYHLLIQYQFIDHKYQIDNLDDSFQLEYPNIIYYKQDKKDFYLIGYTNNKNRICYKNYYYNYVCKKMIQFCQNQFQNQVCKQCRQKHFLINGKCKKCPDKCEFCKILNNQMLCIKCEKNYFLNFQRKCILCELEYCEMCYYSNGQQNTLERNFAVQQKSFKFDIGCSYCQQNSFLHMEQRKCIQKEDQNFIIINSKSFNHNIFNTLKCKEEIFQCQFCQNGQCLQCNENYILEAMSGFCYLNQNNLKLSNFNLNLQDYEMVFNLVTFLYFNYSYIDIIQLQQQYYLIDCQFNNFTDIQNILNIQCDRQILYLTNKKQECPVYCLLCLNNNTCLNYKYMIEFNINLKGQYIKNNFELEIMNSFINNVQLIYQLELNLNTLNIEINQVTPDYFIQPANIPFHPAGQNIILHFPNAFILDNENLYFEEPISIIDSVFNVFKNLTIEFITQQSGKFILKNLIFQGQNNQSSLHIKVVNGLFIIQNVTIQNFSLLFIVIQSDELQIENLNLKNLTITEQNLDLIVFLIYSKYISISGLKIYKCSFENICLFNIKYHINKIENVYIYKVQLNGSNLIYLLFNQKEIFIIERICFRQIVSYNSKIILLENFNSHQSFSTFTSLFIIQQSKFIDSTIIVTYLQSQDILNMNLSRVIIKNNQFKNSVFVYYISEQIYLFDIHITDNYFIQKECFINLRAFFAIHFSLFSFKQNQNQQGQIISLQSLQLIFMNGIIFKNLSFLESQNQLEAYHILNVVSFGQAQLINLYFQDISTSFSVIDILIHSGLLDNILIINVEILENSLCIISIINSQMDNDQIILKNLILENASLKFPKEKGLNSKISFIQISFIFIKISELYFSNIHIEQFNVIRIMNSQKLQVKNLKGDNSTIACLIYSYAFTNVLNQIDLHSITASQTLLYFDSQHYLLKLEISNFQLFQFESINDIFYIKFSYNIGFKSISFNNIAINRVISKTFLEIDTRYSIIQIANIDITQSKLKQILTSIGYSNQFLIQFFKVDNVQCEFEDQFSFMLSSNIIIINQLLFARAINLSFFIASD